MKNISICRLAKDPRFKIRVTVDKEAKKINYINLITGVECEEPELVLQDGTNNSEINQKWKSLIRYLKQDKGLYYKVLSGNQVIEY